MAINHVSMSGNLTRDAELREARDGLPVLSFAVAINGRRRDPETGSYIDSPVFVNCAIFGERTKKLQSYLKKGTKVMVDGRLHYSSYVKDDERRSSLSVTVDQIDFFPARARNVPGRSRQEGGTRDEDERASVGRPKSEVSDMEETSPRRREGSETKETSRPANLFGCTQDEGCQAEATFVGTCRSNERWIEGPRQ